MGYIIETSLVGLTIETTGIALVAVLSFMLAQSVTRPYLQYWTLAWVALTLALAAHLGSLTVPGRLPALHVVHLLGEYVFGFFLVAGCRSYGRSRVMVTRDLIGLLPLAALAVGLAALSGVEPTVPLILHTAVVAGFFCWAFVVLGHGDGTRMGPGRRVVSAALVLLALSAIQYVPIFGYVVVASVEPPTAYLRYTSLYDLILEILLGFGTVIAVMDDVRADLLSAHRDATAARDRLEVLSRLDPMTQSLNRHAFYSLVERGRPGPVAIQGCAAVIDVDGLKHINDSLGHAAGDAAIRSVAKAIRSSIRPADLVFRWGGDEFLVLLFGVYEAEARSRLERLNPLLEWSAVPGSPTPITLMVSYGVASFTGEVSLDTAIGLADEAMYEQKQRHHVDRAG